MLKGFRLTGLLATFYFSNTFFSKLSHNNLALSEGKFERAAICIMNPHKSKTSGLVLFKQESVDGPTLIKGKFTGLKSNSKHGFHIHEFGDLTDGCITAGGHYNPLGMTHGGPNAEIRHVGDLGNVTSDANGNATYEISDNLISLSGKYSIVGRSCVIHADEDDLGQGNFPDSKTTGHAGARLACGVIALCDVKKEI
jgi:Cu-Zn family superoxide dismutase